jgi:diadenosine tetraphosphate (Ap4A) HIT family hydrolase
MQIINEMGTLFKNKLKGQGYNVFFNVGKSAGQTIPHLHAHVVARFENEELSPFEMLKDSKRKLMSSEETLEKIKLLKKN